MSPQLAILLALCIAAMVLTVTVFVHGVLRTWRAARRLRDVERVGQGRCPACGYSVMGGMGETCAECGHRFTDHERRRLEGIYAGLSRMRGRGGPPAESDRA